MERNLSLYIDARGRTALHRSGYSWLAFIALPLWALQRRLWLPCLWTMAATLALHAAVDRVLTLLPTPDLQGLFALAWLLGESWFMGRHANGWHRGLLERRGFVMTATELPALGRDAR